MLLLITGQTQIKIDFTLRNNIRTNRKERLQNKFKSCCEEIQPQQKVRILLICFILKLEFEMLKKLILLILCSLFGCANAWSIGTTNNEIVWEKDLGSEVYDTKFAPDGQTVFAATANGIQQFRASDGEYIKTYGSGLKYPIKRIELSKDGKYLIGGCVSEYYYDTLYVWSLATGEVYCKLRDTMFLVWQSIDYYGFAFSPDSKKIVAVGNNSSIGSFINVFDLNTSQCIYREVDSLEKKQILRYWRNVAFAPDNSVFAVSYDSPICGIEIRDANTYQIKDSIVLGEIHMYDIPISFTYDSKYILYMIYHNPYNNTYVSLVDHLSSENYFNTKYGCIYTSNTSYLFDDCGNIRDIYSHNIYNYSKGCGHTSWSQDDKLIFGKTSSTSIGLINSDINILSVSTPTNINILKINSISPNPTNSQYIINFTNNTLSNVKLYIIDELGYTVKYLINERFSSENNSISVSTSDLHSGKYFIKLEQDGKIDLKQLIIIK